MIEMIQPNIDIVKWLCVSPLVQSTVKTIEQGKSNVKLIVYRDKNITRKFNVGILKETRKMESKEWCSLDRDITQLICNLWKEKA